MYGIEVLAVDRELAVSERVSWNQTVGASRLG
jgi:hypothetical protein